jgi:hypothetical protein
LTTADTTITNLTDDLKKWANAFPKEKYPNGVEDINKELTNLNKTNTGLVDY